MQSLIVSDQMVGETLRAHRKESRAKFTKEAKTRFAYNVMAFLIGDAIALSSAFFVAWVIFFAATGIGGFTPWLISILPAWALLSHTHSLYPGWGTSAVTLFKKQIQALVAVGALNATLLLFLADTPTLPGRLLVTGLLLAAAFLPAFHLAVRSILVRNRLYGYAATIYGAGAVGRKVVDQLQGDAAFGYNPIAFMDDHPQYWGAHLRGIPVVGDTHLVLPEAQVAILAMPNAETEFLHFLMEGPLSYYDHILMAIDIPHASLAESETISLQDVSLIKIRPQQHGRPSSLLDRWIETLRSRMTAEKAA